MKKTRFILFVFLSFIVFIVYVPILLLGAILGYVVDIIEALGVMFSNILNKLVTFRDQWALLKD